LVALLSVYDTQNVAQEGQTPILVLLYGVLAICTGLWILGHRGDFIFQFNLLIIFIFSDKNRWPKNV
jgi:hypothetical protein